MGKTVSNKKVLRQKEPKKLPRKAGVFRAPSPSPTPSLSSSFVAKPSKPKAALPPIRADQVTFAKLGKPQKTANRQTVRKELLGAAVAAKKKQTKVKALPVLAPPPEPMAPPPVPNLEPVAEPWVHVGNLDPETTAEDLQGHFVGCGGIQYVNIRYSSSGVPGHPQHGYRYAIVKFETAEAADAAVALNGSNLMGSDYSLVVEPELLNLPEVQKLPEFRTVAQEGVLVGVPRRKARPTNKHQTASGALTSPVKLAKTRIWQDSAETLRKKRKETGKPIVVGGVSFTMTLV